MKLPLIMIIGCLLAAPVSAQSTRSTDPAAYLGQVIEVLKTEHLNRDKVDWPRAAAEARRMAADATTTEQTYPAIRFLISQLGDPHTGLIPPVARARMQNGQDRVTGVERIYETPSGFRLANGAAYVSVPAFFGNNASAAAYASEGRKVVGGLDAEKPCGWVVDLRNDTGGDMWPMLWGLRGLLGRGPYGGFVTVEGKEAPWILPDPLEKMPLATTGERRIAVLISAFTASAGEFTAMSLKGRPNVRLFGQRTGGFVSGNRSVELPDGAVLMVSGSWGKDRTGRTYTEALEPDEPTPNSQMALEAAMAWLKGGGCR